MAPPRGAGACGAGGASSRSSALDAAAAGQLSGAPAAAPAAVALAHWSPYARPQNARASQRARSGNKATKAASSRRAARSALPVNSSLAGVYLRASEGEDAPIRRSAERERRALAISRARPRRGFARLRRDARRAARALAVEVVEPVELDDRREVLDGVARVHARGLGGAARRAAAAERGV